MRIPLLAVSLLLNLLAAKQGFAISTDPAGNGQPFRIEQPSQTLNYAIRVNGDFDDLGEVGLFAPNFAPRDWALAEGQLLSTAANPNLFSKLGNAFGGDGISTFALPDLRGRVPMGSSPAHSLGQRFGAEQTVLGFVHEHNHQFARPMLSTESTGVTASHLNIQPSLVLTPIIATTGVFPSQSATANGETPASGSEDIANLGSGFGDPFLGEITWIAHDNVPPGWARADGSLLQASSNPALFSILGTQYGGDGQQTFALPDLRGRVAVGTGDGPGRTNRTLGDQFGQPTENLTLAQTPSHTHTIPNTAGGSTLATPGAPPAPQSNLQSSLALTHLVPRIGVFPSRSVMEGEPSEDELIAELGSGTEPLLGSVTIFAGDFEISGHSSASGQLLQINQDIALFSLLGTIYGGDGRVEFGLPDLRGRVAVGAGQGIGLTDRRLGAVFGAEESTLTVANLPSHTHELNFLPGDYNSDGAVDAADYTVWRDNLRASSVLLPHNVHSTTVGVAEYETWRNFYGQTLVSSAPAPEPSTALSVAALVLISAGNPRHRR